MLALLDPPGWIWSAVSHFSWIYWGILNEGWIQVPRVVWNFLLSRFRMFLRVVTGKEWFAERFIVVAETVQLIIWPAEVDLMTRCFNNNLQASSLVSWLLALNVTFGYIVFGTGSKFPAWEEIIKWTYYTDRIIIVINNSTHYSKMWYRIIVCRINLTNLYTIILTFHTDDSPKINSPYTNCKTARQISF